MTAARELSEYAREAFYAWEALRDARDEALCRQGELEDERDQARAIAASLEAEVAAVRALHRPRSDEYGARCFHCHKKWPCETASAVYLP